MKKFLKLPAILAVVFSILFSCSKDIKNEVQKLPFDVSVEDNMLVFNSDKDYEYAIDYLNEIGEAQFNSFESNLGFKSMRSFNLSKNEALPIDDDLFATLLNPQGYIKIGKYKFQIDSQNEKVIVTSMNSTKSLQTLEFNFYENVIPILNGEKQLKGGCSSMKHYNKTYTSNGEVETILQYQKFGIYYKLKAEVVKNQRAVSAYVYLNKTVYWDNGKKSGSFQAGSSVYADYGVRSCEYKFYGGMRSLKSYTTKEVICAWDDSNNTAFSGERWYSDSCN